MTAIDSALLAKIALPIRGGKGARQAREIAELGPVMQPAMQKYAINTFLREAHFLAQTCTESDNYSTYEEYASGEAYEGRADLGNTQPGDGKRYKGRGLIQLTGRANYRKIGAILGLPLEAQPDLAVKPENAVLIACEYWQSRNINAVCDRDDVEAVTRKVNGGLNGLKQRKLFLQRAEAALGGKQADLIAPTPGATAQPTAADRPTGAEGDRNTLAAHPLPPLRLGASGAAVSRLQRMLRHGGATIMVDGSFGGATELAVRQFQQQSGIDADGIVGRRTWWKLAKTAPPVYPV